MNRKGFSLVELLAVIVIVAILSVAAVPAVITISRNNKYNMFCKKVQTIERSAQAYGSDAFNYINEDNKIDGNHDCVIKISGSANGKNHCQVTSVRVLAEKGYVNFEKAGQKNNSETQVLDPRNSQSMLNEPVMIFIVNKRVHAQYIFATSADANKCTESVVINNKRIKELYYKDNTNSNIIINENK